MADENLKSKHGFGALENVDQAIADGKVDAHDILFVKDKNGKPYVGWIDKDGNKVIVEETEKVITVEGDSLPDSGEKDRIYIFGEDAYFWNGTEFVNLCKSTDLSALESNIEKLEAEITTKADSEEVETKIGEIKTEMETKVDTTTVLKMIDDVFQVVEF